MRTLRLWSVSVLVGVIALGVYGVTLAPTITWANRGTDGGDLIAAAATLGVAHPPGYPSYVLLGYLFAQIPLGDVAYRLNLMSAVCMALAAGLTTLGVARVASGSWRHLFVGALGGLAFAFAPMVWSQATIAEVYALNALFVSALMCLLAPALFRSEPIGARRLALIAWLWGLGLGNSLTLAALAPLVLAVWRRAKWGRGLAFSVWVIGLSVYALIPIRAAAHPSMNWGNAVTWPNFIAHVTAELYRGYAFGVPPSAMPDRLIALPQMLVAQFGWSGALFGAIGAYRAWIVSARASAWVALSAGLYAIFALSYNTADSDLYLIPVWLFGAWAIGGGSLAVFDRIRGRIGIGLAAGIVLATGYVAVLSYSSVDASRDRRAADFGQSILSAAPRDAILVTQSDAHTFTLWYYRLVEGQRPDVAVIDARLAGYEWYTQTAYMQTAIDQGRPLHLSVLDSEERWLARLIADNPDRPVCRIDPRTQALMC